MAARAQEHPDSALEQLEGVVVTTSRLPAYLGESVRIVTVLDSVAISTIPASIINDLLKFAVGVDVRQRVPKGSRPTSACVAEPASRLPSCWTE